MSTWDSYKQTRVAPATLWSAAQANDAVTLARLHFEGADLEAKDARGYSPLMLATYAGNAEAFAYLLARGANPNTTDPAGNSVLMGATFKGHHEFVIRLIAAGASITARNNAGLDAHAFAVMFGRTALLALLEHPDSASPIR